MTFDAAQQEMRFAYYSGAPGMFTSAAVWAVAGMVCLARTPMQAVWALFIGGMLIHPLSLLLTRAMGRPARHGRENPLGSLALATTFWMILSLPLAYGAFLLRSEFFFPAMLLVIGGRYLSFATIFGMRIYWACGAALALAGYGLARANMAPELSAFTGAGIEAAFAGAILFSSRRSA